MDFKAEIARYLERKKQDTEKGRQVLDEKYWRLLGSKESSFSGNIIETDEAGQITRVNIGWDVARKWLTYEEVNQVAKLIRSLEYTDTLDQSSTLGTDRNLLKVSAEKDGKVFQFTYEKGKISLSFPFSMEAEIPAIAESFEHGFPRYSPPSRYASDID